MRYAARATASYRNWKNVEKSGGLAALAVAVGTPSCRISSPGGKPSATTAALSRLSPRESAVGGGLVMAARAQTVAGVLLAAVAASSVGGCSRGAATRAASPVSSTTAPPTTTGSTPSSPTPPRYAAATVGTADSPGDIASGFGSIWGLPPRRGGGGR